jgi:hypothetical protein
LRRCSGQGGVWHGNADRIAFSLRKDARILSFAFHDNEEIGPKMLARISRHTGLQPEDL